MLLMVSIEGLGIPVSSKPVRNSFFIDYYTQFFPEILLDLKPNFGALALTSKGALDSIYLKIVLIFDLA